MAMHSDKDPTTPEVFYAIWETAVSISLIRATWERPKKLTSEDAFKLATEVLAEPQRPIPHTVALISISSSFQPDISRAPG